MYLYDTYTREVKSINPIKNGHIGIYTCGPTVYRDLHLGNLRSFLLADWIKRSYQCQGIKVTHVKNITDVGHMRQELLELGEDRVVMAALKAGKSAKEIADHYTNQFLQDESKLNIIPATIFPKATDHVEEMIIHIQSLLEKGLAYELNGNVYFRVNQFPNYGSLSGNKDESFLMPGLRGEVDIHKENIRDFSLWRTAEVSRELQWDSPWGKGFPGWHIECSTMSMKYLGSSFDIHTGGVDNVFPHHEAEIAQSESLTQSRLASCWVHGAHLLENGMKMAKSVGNDYTLNDIELRGLDALSFRYLCLTVRYKNRLNFKFSSLCSAQIAYTRLKNMTLLWKNGPVYKDEEFRDTLLEWRSRFNLAINDNLNLPSALKIVWGMSKSELPSFLKYKLICEFDRVLGLDLDKILPNSSFLRDSISERHLLRKRTFIEHNDTKKRQLYKTMDSQRSILFEKGLVVRDNFQNIIAIPRDYKFEKAKTWSMISSSSDVISQIGNESLVDFTIGFIVQDYDKDAKRCLASILKYWPHKKIEILIFDNYNKQLVQDWINSFNEKFLRIKVIRSDHILGTAEAYNCILNASVGKYVILLDTSIEFFEKCSLTIKNALNQESVGIVGPFGLLSSDLKHFHTEITNSRDVDAIELYFMAFRRSILSKVGLIRQCFNFYRNLDIDFSFQCRNYGYRTVVDDGIQVKRHKHRIWYDMKEDEREKLSRTNYRHFLKRWGTRNDLLSSKKHK
jgi:cysteinyl-tRNA synthetase